MIMATALKGYRLDLLVQAGAHATRRAVPGPQKRYARIRGVAKATASRHLTGDVHSPSTHFLLQLATAKGATAFPLLAEGIAAVNQAQIQNALTQVLEARLAELNETECMLQADEDLQTLRSIADPTPDQLDAAAVADVREAEVQLERAAIRRELAARKRRSFE